eukprot:364948-Chlamydomonas_euryale.AAC.12
MSKVPVVAPLFWTSSRYLATLDPWPAIRAAAAEHALDRQAWWDAITSLAPMEFKTPQQVGRMTRSRPVNGALCNDCDLAAEDIEVVAPGKASVKRGNLPKTGRPTDTPVSPSCTGDFPCTSKVRNKRAELQAYLTDPSAIMQSRIYQDLNINANDQGLETSCRHAYASAMFALIGKI